MANKNSIDLFVERVRDSCDSDYGDFMRKMNLYLIYLKEHLSGANSDVQGKLSEMQTYTQFASNWNVESTKARLLSDVEVLRKMLGHRKYPQLVRTLRPKRANSISFRTLFNFLKGSEAMKC